MILSRHTIPFYKRYRVCVCITSPSSCRAWDWSLDWNTGSGLDWSEDWSSGWNEGSGLAWTIGSAWTAPVPTRILSLG